MSNSTQNKILDSIDIAFRKLHNEFENNAKNKCGNCKCSCEWLEEEPHEKTMCCLCAGYTKDDSCSQCNERHYYVFGY